MKRHRLEDFARQFPENGLKRLLQQSLNVRDLFHLDPAGSTGVE